MHTPTSHIPQHASWASTLQAISTQPLAFCENFPQIAVRHEAFWVGELDYPLLLGSANMNPDRPITRRLDLIERPEAWLTAKMQDMQSQHRIGDALPVIRADFGPVMLGGLFGAPVEFRSDTTWTHEFIDDDWQNAPSWVIAEDNVFWTQLKCLLELLAEAGHGRFLACTPDLGGSADVLLNLRGSVQLALDVIDQPEQICRAVRAIYSAWLQAFTTLNETLLGQGTGLCHWLQLWSNEPYMIPACDFNALIGTVSFRDLFLDDIQQQAAVVGRAIFHLDGPDAARHIGALLELDELQAIQYTPGAGTPSALAQLAMFRQIQAAGKSLLVFCPFDEVLALCEALEPHSLGIIIDQVPNKETLDSLYAEYRRRYGV